MTRIAQLAMIPIALVAACSDRAPPSGNASNEAAPAAPAEAVAETLPQTAASWGYKIDRSPPAMRVEAVVSAIEGRATLAIGCSAAGFMDLTIKPGRETFRSHMELPVRYRIDNGPVAETRGWFVFDTIGFEQANEAGTDMIEHPIVRTVRPARLLRVETTPPGEAPISLRFNLVGLPEVMNRVRSECWVNDPSEALPPL